MKRKKIIGNPVSTPYPRPDWNQTDDTKADFIKNKRDSYPYETVDMADVLVMFIPKVNTVTYVYGKFDMEQSSELHFPIVINDVADDITEETVLILDFTSMERVPTVTFVTDGIKWLNGEPPTIEAGGIYMFSFVRTKTPEKENGYILCIGGAFA